MEWTGKFWCLSTSSGPTASHWVRKAEKTLKTTRDRKYFGAFKVVFRTKFWCWHSFEEIIKTAIPAKKKTTAETFKWEETNSSSRMNEMVLRCRKPRSSYYYSSVFVSGSHQSGPGVGLRNNKPGALRCRYLPSSSSTPAAAPANFSPPPLPEEKWKHTIASLCGIEVLCICMKTNYF